MRRWQVVLAVVFAMFLLRLPDVETKKKKKKVKWLWEEDSLQELCRQQNDKLSQSGSKKTVDNILDLQAFLDLTKGFACLKVETCSRKPVCFVLDTPNLGRKNLSDCSLWKKLFRGLKRNRKIEPVVDSHLSNRKIDKARTDSFWSEVVSSLCKDASVYRFVSDEEANVTSRGEWSSASANASNTDARSSGNGNGSKNSTDLTVKSSANTPGERRGGGSKRLLTRERVSINSSANNNETLPSSFPNCEGLNEGCTRICIGQNEKLTNVPHCSTFKIHCTFRTLFRRSTGKKSKKKNRRRD